MGRPERRAVAAETLEILDAGGYWLNGEYIDITPAMTRAVDGTTSYPPDTEPSLPPTGGFETETEVVNETSFAGALRLVRAGAVPCVLNFASATKPGGGFINGAQAQEECLARASALYPCIQNNAMYPYHRERRGALYSHYILYSPEVPVFRDDDDVLINAPYTCAIVTAAAVNKSRLRRDEASEEDVTGIMAERIDKLLSVMRFHEHADIVLGAWGCGVFANDPHHIAMLFKEALEGKHRGAFRRVVFSVLDTRPLTPLFSAFFDAFGASRPDVTPNVPEASFPDLDHSPKDAVQIAFSFDPSAPTPED